eukprot:905751_1
MSAVLFVVLSSFSTISQSLALNDVAGKLTVDSKGIGWIKFVTCDNSQTWSYHSPFTNIQSVTDLAPFAIAFKWDREPQDKNWDIGYFVEAKVCTNPIYNLNNLKEMTFTTDIDTGLITGLHNYDNWICTSNGRLEVRGYPYVPCYDVNKGVLPHNFTDIIYRTYCGSGAGLNMAPGDGLCKMASSHAGSSYNPTVELFLGFDPALVFFCVNDGNGNYVLSTADPTAHPSTATANPSTAKPTGNPSTAEPSTADPTTADPT